MRYGLVLIKIGNSRPGTVLDWVSNVKGILDIYAVFGRFDLVVFIGAEDYYRLKDVAAEDKEHRDSSPRRLEINFARTLR